MSNTFTITNGYLEDIGHGNNFHIKELEVFTGDDDYQETACYKVTEKDNDLVMYKRTNPEVVKSLLRIRHEPGVRVYLESETDDAEYYLQICHHKGCVCIDLYRNGIKQGWSYED